MGATCTCDGPRPLARDPTVFVIYVPVTNWELFFQQDGVRVPRARATAAIAAKYFSQGTCPL